MDTYITGAVIKRLRENKNLTQSNLAEMIGVSSKAVSKWETGKGLPDISLIEPLITLPVAIAADALPILVAISAEDTAKLFDFMLLFYALYTFLFPKSFVVPFT